MRGEARFSHGELRGAEEDFSKVIALAGTQPSSDGLPVGDGNDYKFLAFLDRALAKTQRADLGGARSDLTSALAAIPEISAAPAVAESTNQQSQQIIRRLVGVFGTARKKGRLLPPCSRAPENAAARLFCGHSRFYRVDGKKL